MSRWPDFFIVGAPKAGTTSLFTFLGQHPAVFLPQTKEPHYFCPDTAARLQIEYTPSEQAYLDLFKAAGAGQLCGEASTAYLRAPETPELLKSKVPAAKIIILLREPGERAFSHYLMRWRAGGFRISFAEGLANFTSDKEEYRLFRQLVINPGFYADQVPRYIASFGRDRVKIIVSEEFSANPEKTVKETLAFLGIEDTFKFSTFKRHNDYVEPRGKLSLMLLQHKHHLRFLKRWIPAQLKWHIVRKYFSKSAPKPSFTREQRQHLGEIYDQDVRELRRVIGRHDLWSDTFPIAGGK